jgi:hypothetical protein
MNPHSFLNVLTWVGACSLALWGCDGGCVVPPEIYDAGASAEAGSAGTDHHGDGGPQHGIAEIGGSAGAEPAGPDAGSGSEAGGSAGTTGRAETPSNGGAAGSFSGAGLAGRPDTSVAAGAGGLVGAAGGSSSAGASSGGGAPPSLTPLVYDTAAELQVFADHVSHFNPGTLSTEDGILSWEYDFAPSEGMVGLTATSIYPDCSGPTLDWSLASKLSAVVRVTGAVALDETNPARVEIFYEAQGNVSGRQRGELTGDWQTVQVPIHAPISRAVCDWGLRFLSGTASGVLIEIDSIRVE